MIIHIRKIKSRLLFNLKNRLYLIGILSILGLSGFAQERSLKSVLNDIEKNEQIYFSYNPDEIKQVKIPSNEALNKSNLENQLGPVLLNNGLLITKVNEKFYVIKKEASKFLDLTITDGETGDPLPFSIVRLIGTELGQVSDDYGRLKLVITKPSTSILSVSFLGFQDYRIAADTLAELTKLTVPLSPVPTSLNDFEIKEYLNVGIASDPMANSFRIYPQEMEILPGLSERDVLLSAQMIAGVNSNDESAAGINLRGSSRDNTLLYWNNIPIYHTAHYFGNISSFIPSSIGVLDIYKNYIPVKYGGAAAGIIDLQSRNAIDAESRVEGSINMTHIDLYAKLPFKKELGSFMIAGRRSYNDFIPTWTYNSYEEKLFSSTITVDDFTFEEGESSNDLNFTDFNFQWNFEPTSRTNLSASFVRSQSDFTYSERDREERINFDQNHNISSLGANINYQHRLNDNNALNATASYSQYQMGYSFLNLRNPSNPDDDDEESRTNDLYNFEFRLSNTRQLNRSNWLEYGYQLNLMDVTTSLEEENFIEEDDSTSLTTNGLSNAFFLDYSFKPTEKIELVLSSRFTQLSTIDDLLFSPQIKFNYKANKNLLFKASFGTYQQFLSTVKEQDFTLSNAVEQIWLLSDEENLIPVIRNNQLSAGFVYDANNWLFDLDVYQKDIDGLLARNLGFATLNEDGFEQGSERILGIDLTARKRWRYFRTWFNYSFQDSEVEFPELFPNSFASSLNIRHQLRLSSTYSLPKWEFSLGYTFKTGLPFTDVSDIIIRDDDERPPRRGDDNPPPPPPPGSDNEEDFFFLDFDSPNSSRLPNYHRVDVSIWHKWKSKGNKVKGEIGLSLMNIFNRQNVFDTSYFIDFDENDEVQLFQQTKYFLDFTPNLTFRVIF